MTQKNMYNYHLWILLFILLAFVEASELNNNNNSNNNNNKPSDISSSTNDEDKNNDNNNNNKEWLGLRVFADTSMLMMDPDSCDRVGKYVKVGKPEEEENGEKISCSNLIVNDCWKLCEEKDVLSVEKAEQIADLMKPVVNWFRSVVKVKRIAANIIIPKAPPGCADHLPLPEYYNKGGIKSTDLVLIVTGRPTPSNTVAWAAECAADSMGRPVFGHINIGPGELEDFENQKQYIYKVLLHELTHVIGFNSYKFPFYRDSSGNLYKSVTKNQVINGKKISKIITPRVVAEARLHFNCPDMDGVPLEDGGDRTTSDSHWEKRIFRNEYMTGSSDHTAVISSISLALLEDTGWYRVDYSHAEHLEWGRGMGCNFVNDRCNEWGDQKGYFCSQPGATACTVDRSAIGYCNLIKHKDPLPTAVQYFSDPYFGGSDALSDNCPVVAAYSNGICSDARNQPSNSWFGENFGENSKCFDSSLVKQGYWKKQDAQPMCYDFKCVEEEDSTKLQVLIGDTWHFCPYGGQLTSVNGFDGSLTCPDSSFCSEKTINTRDYDHIKDVDSSSLSTNPFLLFLLFIQMSLLLLL